MLPERLHIIKRVDETPVTDLEDLALNIHLGVFRRIPQQMTTRTHGRHTVQAVAAGSG